MLALTLLALSSEDGWTETLFRTPLFKVGDNPVALATGDFNGDGRNDLAVANISSNDVSILIGNGDGSFASEVRIPAGARPSSIAVGYLNADAWQDLVVTNAASDTVLVLLGHADGTFAPQNEVYVGDEPSAVAIGDLNGDGFSDIVVTNTGSDDFSTLIGRGDGTFTALPRAHAGRRPSRVILADIDRDGFLDLAIENLGDVSPYAYGDVSVFIGQGNGSFLLRKKILYSLSFTFTLGDLNRDGSLDLVLVDQGGLIRLYRWEGNDFFFVKDTDGLGYSSAAVAAQDLDLDGNLDLISVSRGSSAAWVALGNGDFTFRSVTHVRYGGSDASDFSLDDFNGDGMADLAIANSFTDDVALLAGSARGFFSVQPHLTALGPPSPLVAGDFNMDGKPDLLSLTYDSALVLYIGEGQGRFTPQTLSEVGFPPYEIAVSDFDGDGNRDLAVLNGGSEDVSVLLGLGDGSFAPEKRFAVGYFPTDIVAGEFNGDDHPDLAVATYCSPLGFCNKGAVIAYLGQGNGTFGPPAYYQIGLTPGRLAAGDFNGDGIQDLAALNAGSGIVSELSGFGDGTFASQRQIQLFNNVSATDMTIVDWQGDGWDDLVLPVLDRDQYYGIILNGSPSGLYISGHRLYAGESPRGVVSGDFNADGFVDFAMANLISDDVALNLGDPHGSPFTFQSYPAVDCAASIAAADLDGDGRMDLAVGSWCRPEIAVMLNIGPFPDTDKDAIRDTEDRCTDPDGDGYGSPGFPANTCAPDNCPRIFNPSQEDGDGDDVGDPCDDCPGAFNPEQNDRDHDGMGDACDTCTDIDRDGLGNPGFSGNLCALDNCPFRPNGNQSDADSDGLGDVCDACTDLDHDGYGNPGFPVNTCRADNCPGVPNPLQENADYDSRGDACDPCPLDPYDDQDRDGHCADVDTCPQLPDPAQEDADEDGRGDRCDNCPTASNADQQDSNDDGAGDACQPTVILSSILQNGGPFLEVAANARDPQGETVMGSLEFYELLEVSLQNPGLEGIGCGFGFALPEWRPGQGIAYLSAPEIGGGFLFDLDWLLPLAGLPACEDGQADFFFWQGACFQTTYRLGPSMYVSIGDFCIRPVGAQSDGSDFTIVHFNDNSLQGTIMAATAAVQIPFETGLPRQSDVSRLLPGRSYKLIITATDGSTPPVKAEGQFVYQGETTLVINSAPHAAITAADRIECDRTGGAVVLLDGSSSTDTDSTGTSHDDIVLFEWVLAPGQPEERLLAVGETATVVLPLGMNHIGLRATDSQDSTDVSQVTIEVGDTSPPSLVCPSLGALECTGQTGAQIELVAQASDLCGPVTVTNSRTAGPAASGVYPLGSTEVMFLAIDASGNVSTCSTKVTVRDTTPPSLALSADTSVLWPPNHRMVAVHLGWQADDRCDPSPGVMMVSASNSEPDDADGDGDGRTTGDIDGAEIGAPDTQVSLRAERSASGPGRLYELSYLATDVSGNTTGGLVVVSVPHDVGMGPEPLHLRAEPGSAHGTVRLYWNAVPGADGYEVVSGGLAEVSREPNRTILRATSQVDRNGDLTSFDESAGSPPPLPGQAWFYLVQYRDARGESGYGTSTTPWPLLISYTDE